jgi:hypothetical protein
MSVKSCSKAFLAAAFRHGKSPCFLQVDFLTLFGPDYALSILPCLDGTESVECAF